MVLLKTTTTEQFRLAFQQTFPLLDIKFYRVAHDHFKGSMQKDELTTDSAFGQLK